jgi:exosortase/archaeosortase family protein
MRLVLSFYLFRCFVFRKVKTNITLFWREAYWFYVLNVMRIAMLSVLMYHFPGQVSFLHGVLFPLFIYGVVFILWVIWVSKFSLYANTAVT